MESTKLNKNELINLIFYGIKENGINIDSIKNLEIELEFIIEEYTMLCNHFQKKYVIGELDTFKKAACLLVAINKSRLSSDKTIKASIALETTYKMCEKPFWNVGTNYDIPKKLEEVDFKKVFENDMEIYNTSRNILLDSLTYEDKTPLNYYLNLELFYKCALLLKNRSVNSCEKDEQNVFSNDQVAELDMNEVPKQKRKFLNLFRK